MQKLEKVLYSKKTWSKFQEKYFPGKHSGSASRIMDRIEEDYVKSKSVPDND